MRRALAATHARCAITGAGEWSLRETRVGVFINEQQIRGVRTPLVTADPWPQTSLTLNVNTRATHFVVAFHLAGYRSSVLQFGRQLGHLSLRR